MARYAEQSPLTTAIGALVALVAVIGTQFFGWEWGDGQLIPTLIGVLAVGLAVGVAVRWWR